MLEPRRRRRATGSSTRSLASWRRTGSPALGIDEAWIADITGRSFDRSFDPTGVLRQFGAIVGSPDRRPGLGGVTAPTLVVHGTIDPIVHARAAARRRRRRCPARGSSSSTTWATTCPRAMWPRLLRRGLRGDRRRRRAALARRPSGSPSSSPRPPWRTQVSYIAA